MERRIVIDARFRGPPDSANGGYAAGVVAEGIEGIATSTLRVPPPLGTPLLLTADGTESTLRHGDVVVGEAIAADLDLAVPAPPTLEEATAAADRYIFRDGGHVFPTCFVCGPDREVGDGLRIFPGGLEGSAVVAAPWLVDASLARGGAPVDHRYAWAALDCPSYFALDGTPLALLGRLTADIDRVPVVGETLIAMGWPVRVEGRKHFSGSALATPDGDVIARAAAVWIGLKR